MGEQLDILFPAAKAKAKRKARAPKAKPVAPPQRVCVGFSVRAGFCDRGAGHDGPHGCGETTWRVSERGVVVHDDEQELCGAKLIAPSGMPWLGEERLCSREVGHDGDHENACGDVWAEGSRVAPCGSCIGTRTETDGITTCAACEGTGREDEAPSPSCPVCDDDRQVVQARGGVAEAEPCPVCSDAPTTARACPSCGAALVWDADKVGETCGGLELRGWWRCDPCGGWWLATNAERRELVAGAGEAWVLTRGGRSVDAGGVRLRAEGGDAVALMRRVVVLPELEAALARIAAGESDAQALARRALALVEVAT